MQTSVYLTESSWPDPDSMIDPQQLQRLIQALQVQGWCVLDAFFAPELVQALYQEAVSLTDEQMQQAGIGRQQDHQLDLQTRRDCILWIDQVTPARTLFLRTMEVLRVALNRALLLGLFDYESHYARYYPGGYYGKHLDAFKERGNRVLSTVLYLNEDWKASQGGALVLYDEHQPEHVLGTFMPLKGRFAVFLSEAFYHEVSQAKACRHSIAGWFRINTSRHNCPDPGR